MNSEKKYDGFLGYRYSKNKTEFTLFAPYANKVEIILNDEIYEMIKNEENGTFNNVIIKDLNNYTYMYKIYYENEILETIDPYAIACNANSEKGMIIDISKTNPRKFERMKKFSNPLDAIIYELHIRDFTLNAENKGKYLGLIEKKQLNYLKKLGVTHVQILPFYDFSTDSVDELNPDLRYNWGYDPVNYNIPEGSYSTNPNDPYIRIKELKKMINELHKNGIRVIMDVVYNHVYDAMAHSLYKTMKKDAFRFNGDQFSNGSACGNDISSEKYMVRKYIVDSIKYWANEYKLDGFRFDLMGILDIDTMNEIRKELDKIDDGIIILGEGWDLNTNLSPSMKANQLNANKMPRISFFNDDIRDALRGSTFEKLGRGYITNNGLEKRLINSIQGGYNLKSYIEPNQVIQYIEAHDNNTVFDHISLTNKDFKIDKIIKRHAIATSIILTSQGIPFIHAGQEFFRTKNMVENSYKSSDDINKFDFERSKKYKRYVKYFSDLIEFRKNNKLFKLDTFDEINEKLNIIKANKNIIAYSLNDEIVIIANVSNKIRKVNIGKGKFKMIFSKFNKVNYEININKDYEISSNSFVVLRKVKYE